MAPWGGGHGEIMIQVIGRTVMVAVAAAALAACPLSGTMMFKRVAKTPEMVLEAPGDAAVLRYRLVELDAAYFKDKVLAAAADPFRPPTTVRLNLFADVRVLADLSLRGSADAAGPRVLSGPLPGVDGGLATLVVDAGGVSGTVWIGERLFRIGREAGGLYRIEEVDSGRFPYLREMGAARHE